MKSKPIVSQRRRRPGTAVMFIGIATFGAISFFGSQSAADRTYYEADRGGNLKRVDMPSAPLASPMLWKPEPQILLAPENPMGLSSDQRRQIEGLAQNWIARKAVLEAKLAAHTSFLKQPGQSISRQGIEAGLGEYSELSRQFGYERELAWSGALAVLSEAQRRRSDEVLR